MTLIFIILTFFIGALPFSVWLGQVALKTDIRTHGDQNPGCSNVLRAGGWRWGALALMLDSFKGAIPLWLARFAFGWHGWPLVGLALAPILGHAFSPFLRFRGGKAVAVTFGIWAGLTLWEIPTLLGLALGIWFAFMAISGWAMMFAMLSLLPYLWYQQSDWLLLTIWLGNTLILAWKHHADLVQWPRLRERFQR